jgi:hypothetical protein
MDPEVLEPPSIGSAGDAAAGVATTLPLSSEVVDAADHGDCKDFIRHIHSEPFGTHQMMKLDTSMPKLRDGSVAACQGCALLLDAIDTYSHGCQSKEGIEKITVSVSVLDFSRSRSGVPGHQLEITLHYSPNKTFHSASSPSREKDMDDVQLELFLLPGMLNVSFHSVVYTWFKNYLSDVRS